MFISGERALGSGTICVPPTTQTAQHNTSKCDLERLAMKRTAAERDAFGSRLHDRASPTVGDMKGGIRQANPELDGEEAKRVKAMQSLRQKRTKPQDWTTNTFHQYTVLNVVGAGTFGQVCMPMYVLDLDGFIVAHSWP